MEEEGKGRRRSGAHFAKFLNPGARVGTCAQNYSVFSFSFPFYFIYQKK